MRLSASALAQIADARRRLIRCAVVALTAMALLYIFRVPVFAVLAAPLFEAPGAPNALMITGLPEIFFLYVKIAAWGGLFVTVPYIIWEIWRFIRPGLYPHERGKVWPMLLALPVLFYGGGLFSYFLVTPAAIGFFLGFEVPGLFVQPTVREYLDFLLGMGFAFGLTFNMPLVLLALIKVGLLQVETLRRQRRLVIVLIFVAAALLTPTPDPVTQSMLAVPLWLFYEGVLVLASKKVAKKAV